MAKDPYKLLEVSKTATDDEIRKSYRKLAKKYHPDVNKDNPKAAEKFKEISAAYTLLSDENLRRQYDTGEVDASGQQQAPFGFGGGGMRGGQFQQADGFDDMSELFSSLFGMNMGGMRGAGMDGMGATRRTYARPSKGADVRYKMTLTFPESLEGGTKRVRMGNGQTLDVKIPRGVDNGATLRLRGKGQPGQHGGPSGDAKVDITVKNHKYLTRDRDNIHLTLPISLQEAVLGASVRISMPSGTVQVKIPAGTNTGKTMRLKGKGLKNGDLYVTLQIILENPSAESLKTWASEAKSSDFNPRQGIFN